MNVCVKEGKEKEKVILGEGGLGNNNKIIIILREKGITVEWR